MRLIFDYSRSFLNNEDNSGNPVGKRDIYILTVYFRIFFFVNSLKAIVQT